MQPRGPLARSYRFLGTDPKLPAIDLSDGTSVVPFTSVVTAAGGAGSIATTADDLVHWGRARTGVTRSRRTMRASMVADVAADRPLPAAHPVRPRRPDHRRSTAIRRSATRAGSWARGRSSAGCPANDIAIAVLTNQSRSDPNVILANLLKVALEPRSDCIDCPAVP